MISKAALDAAGEVADLLIRKHDPESMPVLLDYCDRLLLAGKIQETVRLWNSLAEHDLVSSPVLAGGALTGRRSEIGGPAPWLCLANAASRGRGTDAASSRLANLA